jgi:hypothetical protein
MGRVTKLLGGIVFVGVGAWLLAPAHQVRAPSPALEPINIPALSQSEQKAIASGAKKAVGQQDDCTSRWLAAEKAKIVLGQGIVRGVPTMMVDESTFRRIDFATKLGMVTTLDCAIAGPGKHLTEIVVVSNLTNRRLARWTPVGGLVVD